MTRGIILWSFSCLALGLVDAQVQPLTINSNAAAAYESLLRLRTTVAVVHTTAHPDDEDGGLITFLSRGQGVRTALLTLTRGEGGANLIGSEQFDALGVVRTEELLAAGRYYGVDQFFTRLTDFGFSKQMDETLEHWGKDNVLRDSVRVIRMYRPDVIVSRFHGAARDGHGNHQTAGWMSGEVFKAAADPTKFPEQLSEGLRPWQVKKLYRLVRENEPSTLKIDTGIYDPMLGMSYRQLAARGLSFQRSQGSGGRGGQPGPAISSLVLVATALGEKPAQEASLFDGLDTTLRGLSTLAPSLNLDVPLGEIEKDITRAIEEFDARDPSRVLEPHIVPALRNLRAVIRNVSDAPLDEAAKYELLFRLRNKEDEFMRAGTLLAGVSFEVLANPGNSQVVAIPGQKFELTGTFTNRANLKMDNVELGLTVRGGIQFSSKPAQRDELGYNEKATQQFEVTVGDDAEYSQPYWSRQDVFRQALYNLDQPQYANLPYAPPEIIGTASYRIGGVRFSTTQTVMGAGNRPLLIVPAISISLAPRRGVIPASRRQGQVELHVEVMSNAASAADAKIHLELPQGWTATPSESALHFTHVGEIQNAEFRVNVAQVAAGKSYKVQALAEFNGKQYRDGYEIIAHPDLETQHLFHPASAELTGVDVRVAPGLKIGYIMGAGDEVPEALEQLGIKPQMLSATDLASGNLSQFDAILVGLRASAVRPDYKTYNSRLLDYAKNGGNLIVQYQTPEFDEIQYGPYPYQMGKNPEEVSEENSKITILDPANPIFAGPNKITGADFDNWVEERGSKFLTTWDPQYKALLECHDRDQPPQKGGLLVARYGKGTFTYIAYALYRQLPAGVPGAYRLLANLISLSKSPQMRAETHR
jgi:LmbE family N-acetylglucosaminyl deacetylase